jgi:hypothetical protein
MSNDLERLKIDNNLNNSSNYFRVVGKKEKSNSYVRLFSKIFYKIID